MSSVSSAHRDELLQRAQSTHAPWHTQALVPPHHSAPSTEQLVDGAVAILEQVPNLAFPLADLLTSHSVHDARKPDRAIMARLLQRLTGLLL